MKKRVLIVGTSPFDLKTPARAFDSYFHYWESENLAQIFSITSIPMKGHCSTLYQLTDKDMLGAWVCGKRDLGKIYKKCDLSNLENDKLVVKGGETYLEKIVRRLYKLGHNKNSVIYLMRGFLWRKKYWCTKKLNRWLDEFKPECVFLSFSDDYFIPQIALYVARRFDIPIVSSIGDDYYFNYKYTMSPFYHLYKLTYRKLIRKVFSHGGSAIYIGNKIRDKYNTEFRLNGETVYLTSSIERREFKVINRVAPKISYFGNVRLGRNKSLVDIADALKSINSSYTIDVYSNELDEKFLKVIKNNSNIKFHGAISYSEVKRLTVGSDIIIVAEGFKKKDVDISRYSLSTKVADSLASGVNVLAYGSAECGAIEYAASTGAIAVCTDKGELKRVIEKMILDVSYQRYNYDKAIEICDRNHTLTNSCYVFEDVIEKAIRMRNEKC